MSDSADRNIVIGVFLFFYVYICYIRAKINIKNDWQNLKCNPTYMFATSLFESNAKSKQNFQECVLKMTNNALNDKLDQVYKQRTKDMSRVSQLSKDLSMVGNNVDTTKKYIDKSIQSTNDSLDQIKNAQTEQTKLNNNVAAGLNTFTSSFNNVFKNINSYLPTITK